MRLVLSFTLLALISCSKFKAERQNAQESDEKALTITDNWVDKDTENATKDLIAQLRTHPAWIKYLSRKQGGETAMFIAELQNKTAEAYFPMDDLNNEMLNEFSRSGEFVLVDAAAREKLLGEIQYQNDGMVDPKTAKSIGKQTGADILLFGSVQMKPEQRDGKTVKQYSVDIRLTDLEKGVEVARARAKVYKFSEKKLFGL
jgi:uncharacterized protein (TIGR02722 family)